MDIYPYAYWSVQIYIYIQTFNPREYCSRKFLSLSLSLNGIWVVENLNLIFKEENKERKSIFEASIESVIVLGICK